MKIGTQLVKKIGIQLRDEIARDSSQMTLDSYGGVDTRVRGALFLT